MTLRRLRFLFVLAAIAVLVPIGVLGHRAVSSAEAEHDLEVRTVADRVVDEMERELNAFLLREEDRPYAHYRRFLLEDRGDGPTTSPLATPLPEPFVVGPFVRTEDGSVSSPLEADPSTPRATPEAVVSALGGWRPGRASGTDVPSLGDRPGGVASAARAGSQAPLAGSTEELRIADEARPKEKKEAAASALQALQQLNRAADVRQKRASKLTQTQAYNVLEDVASEASERDAVESLREVDVRLEPMVGSPLADDRMVLYRTAVAEGRVVRQGLVLDTTEMVRWLARRTGTAAPSPRTKDASSPSEGSTYGSRTTGLSPFVRVEPAGASPAPPPEATTFRHRFAEPFSPTVALVSVSSRRLWSPADVARFFSISLLVAVALGLAALYRMTSVVLRSSEQRTNFVSAVSHELKTPLTAIRMYSEMLREGVVSEEADRQRYYRTITAEGERLSRLVDNVLEFGKLERREGPGTTVRASVEPVLRAAAELLGPHAESRRATLLVEVPADLPTARFDPDALQQIVVNLVDNAIKYAGRDRTATIRLQASVVDAGRVEVRVVDDGPGVPARDLRRIFRPFWRAGNELTRETNGTGIGLALVRGLAERMGARVEAANRQGGGLEVRVRLAAG